MKTEYGLLRLWSHWQCDNLITFFHPNRKHWQCREYSNTDMNSDDLCSFGDGIFVRYRVFSMHLHVGPTVGCHCTKISDECKCSITKKLNKFTFNPTYSIMDGISVNCFIEKLLFLPFFKLIHLVYSKIIVWLLRRAVVMLHDRLEKVVTWPRHHQVAGCWTQHVERCEIAFGCG